MTYASETKEQLVADPSARVRVSCEGKIRARHAVTMSLRFESEKGHTWPDNYKVVIFLVPQSTATIDPFFSEFMPESSEPLYFQYTPNTAGKHTLKIEVVDHKTGYMLQVLSVSFGVAP